MMLSLRQSKRHSFGNRHRRGIQVMFRPLEGVRVVDFSTAGAGPSCTKLLSEYGADDILIEPFGGNTTRTVFKVDFYNTGKRSIVLNLKTEEGIVSSKTAMFSCQITAQRR